MEFFYYEDLHLNRRVYELEGEEFKHFKALRLEIQDTVCLVNGKGLSAVGYVAKITNSKAIIKVSNFFENLGEIQHKIDLAIGLLESRERLEFALEKGIELRISAFIPLWTKYTQRKSLDPQRLIKKSISAIKQAQRSVLPKIWQAITLEELINQAKEWGKIYVLDPRGKRFNPRTLKDSNLVVVGPEGGLSKEEINFVKQYKNVEIISLGENRFRSETSAVFILSLIYYYLARKNE